jgi:hypothetical protein
MPTPTYTCFSCGGAFHTATGDYDRVWDMARCGVCMTRFLKWLKGHLEREWSGAAFYEEARTSVRPGISEDVRAFPYVPTSNPKAKDKPSKRPGRWKAGPDGARVPVGPKRVQPRVWVEKD